MRNRLGRHGLPLKSERILFNVTPGEKASVRAAALAKGMTITDYLLALHREALKGSLEFTNGRPIVAAEAAKLAPGRRATKGKRYGKR